MLHVGDTRFINKEDIQKILRVLNTSSPSTILVMSLDAAREQIATNGYKLLNRTLEISRYARENINKIGPYRCYGREVVGIDNIADMDETKLLIDVSTTGFTGYELEKILGRKYKVEIEMSDIKHILCLISIGNSISNMNKLVHALKDISKKGKKLTVRNTGSIDMPDIPELVLTPREAFFTEKKLISLSRAEGEICGEFVIPFPPDIPIIAPGERITNDIIEYINFLKKNNVTIIGTEDSKSENIKVIIS